MPYSTMQYIMHGRKTELYKVSIPQTGQSRIIAQFFDSLNFITEIEMFFPFQITSILCVNIT